MIALPSIRLPGLTVERIKQIKKPTAMFDLALSIREVDETGCQSDLMSDAVLRLNLTYKADLFKADRMAQLLAQYQRLLAQIVEQPEIRLSDLLHG